MIWVQVALTFLKLANVITNYVRERQLMDAGSDRAIAQASANILKQTQAAKEIMAEVTAMTDEQVDETLKRLEP